jgi:hypothetical protein
MLSAKMQVFNHQYKLQQPALQRAIENGRMERGNQTPNHSATLQVSAHAKDLTASRKAARWKNVVMQRKLNCAHKISLTYFVRTINLFNFIRAK